MQNVKMFIIPNSFNIGGDVPTQQNSQPTHHKYIGFAFDYAHPAVAEAKVIELIEEHLIEGKINHTQYAEIVDKLNALDDDVEVPFVYVTHDDIVSLSVEINTWVEAYPQS